MKYTYHYIYCTTNLINNKKYIGLHKTNDLNDNYIGSGRIFLRALKKYKKLNFKKEIIEFCEDEEELKKREIYWIAYYDASISKEFYNNSTGGESKSGVKLREEEKIRISNTLKKYYADNPEMRSKIGLRNLGKKMTSESLEKQLKTREIKKSNYRKVLEYKKSGEIIEHDGLKNIIKLYAESCNRLSKLDFLVFKERLFIYKDKVKENINYFEILKSFKILQNTRKINVENIKTNFIKQYDSIQEFCIEHNFTYCSVYTAIIKNRIYRKEFLIKRYERTNK